MGNFNRGGQRDGGGFKRGFGGGKSFGGSKRFTEMHKATCSECGSICEVPFRPTGERPVFCSNCFEKQKSEDGRSSNFGGERRERPRFEDRQMHDAVCAKCGNDCQVPFRPTAGKPVFCVNCFDKSGRDRVSSGSGEKDSNQLVGQVKTLNEKIDKLMKILMPNAPAEKKIEKSEIKKAAAGKEGMKEKKEKKEKAKAAPKKAAVKKKK